MGNHHSNTRNNPPNLQSKKQNKQRHSTGCSSSNASKSSPSILGGAEKQQQHPLVKPLNLLQLKNVQQDDSMTMKHQSTSLQQQYMYGGSVQDMSRRLTATENEGSLSSRQQGQNNNGRQLLVDFHASAKTPRHVRTIIDDEEDDNIEESFVMMRSGMIYSHEVNEQQQDENPSSLNVQPSPSSVRTSNNIPINSQSLNKLLTSPVSPHSDDKKAYSMPNLGVNSASPKKKQALKLLAKIKNKFNHNTERTSPTALQPSLSDSSLSSRSAVSCTNIQQQLSSSSLLKIDSHRSMQSYATTNSSNNNSSTTLVTNGQPNQKPLKINEDGEYVDEDTYSNNSESLDVSDSEQGDDEDYIEQFIQGTMVQTIDDSISYLKNSMRNQLA